MIGDIGALMDHNKTHGSPTHKNREVDTLEGGGCDVLSPNEFEKEISQSDFTIAGDSQEVLDFDDETSYSDYSRKDLGFFKIPATDASTNEKIEIASRMSTKHENKNERREGENTTANRSNDLVTVRNLITGEKMKVKRENIVKRGNKTFYLSNAPNNYFENSFTQESLSMRVQAVSVQISFDFLIKTSMIIALF